MVEVVNVKNRSTSKVCYKIDETGVRRTWAPGEIKKNISVEELEKASYTPGVLKLFEKYLVINEGEVCEHLGIAVEPEYFYSEDTIEELLLKGTLDQLLDCLDFAPGGVIDLLKDIAVKKQLNDVSKRNAIKEATGFDITSAIENVKFSTADTDKKENKTGRRAKPVGEKDAPKKSGRRTAAAKNKSDKED